MWTYRGKEEEDGQTYDGKMHARDTWQRWVWKRTTRQTGQHGGIRSSAIPATSDDGISQGRRRRGRNHCILASVLFRVPPLTFPSLPISLPPTLLLGFSPSLSCSISPPIASSLPSFPRSVHAYVPSSFVPFLNPPYLPPLPLPPSLTSSLPHSLHLPPSFHTLPLLPPSHPPSFLAHSLTPSLPACLPSCNSMYTVCVLTSCT